MRKLIFHMMITLDGFYAGPEGDIDWHTWDEEMSQASVDLVESVDVLIFGRKTYEVMAAYWPTATDNIARRMNELPKIVVSRTLENADWENSTVIRDKVAERLRNLKELPGKDMAILGSSELAASLIDANVIDEYRISVTPVVLGAGKRFLDGINKKHCFKKISSKAFPCGNMTMSYEYAAADCS